MTKELVKAINTLADFCGKQDLENLTQATLKKQTGLTEVDVLVLFGGSILAGVDVLATGIQEKIAKKTIIVGGYGHTSASLFETAHAHYPKLGTDMTTEAELFARLLKLKYNLSPDYIETDSTNCGNNIGNLLTLLQGEELPCESIILIQDSAMQLRMDLTLRKQSRQEIKILNFPAYSGQVIEKNQRLAFKEEMSGMWPIERYISLLLGEITRVRDDENGYGPSGKNYLVHCDLPPEVLVAFDLVKAHYPHLVRQADSRFKSN